MAIQVPAGILATLRTLAEIHDELDQRAPEADPRRERKSRTHHSAALAYSSEVLEPSKQTA